MADDINFPVKDPEYFKAQETVKITFDLRTDGFEALTALMDRMGMNKSEMVRWCVEQVLLKAIQKNVITDPTKSDPS